MIREFRPKVFALKMGHILGLETGVVEFGAEMSAGIGAGLRKSALFTANSGGKLFRPLLHFILYFLSLTA
jgi:hypothetical protein